jgi:hypothetical protein
MPIFVQYSSPALNLNGSKGKIHKLSFGNLTVTPRTLGIEALHVAGETSASTGHSSGQKQQHQPLVISKEMGTSSPQLLNAHWRNEILTRGTTIVEPL